MGAAGVNALPNIGIGGGAPIFGAKMDFPVICRFPCKNNVTNVFCATKETICALQMTKKFQDAGSLTRTPKLRQ